MGDKSVLEIYSAETISEKMIPFVGGISAGFPSPANDYLENSIDLNKELIKNPSSTFFARVKGLSLIKLGIHNDDLMIIDKSLVAQDGDLAVCFIDGDFTTKIISKTKDGLFLLPANDDFKPIPITEQNDFQVWGIVTVIITPARNLKKLQT